MSTTSLTLVSSPASAARPRDPAACPRDPEAPEIEPAADPASPAALAARSLLAAENPSHVAFF